MIKVETSLADVLVVELSGTVEESDVETMEEAFEGKLDADDRFGLVVDMSGWTDITVDALKEDAKFEFGLLSKLNRFPRMALISDKKFPRAVAKFFDPIFPAVEIRTFSSSERDQAMAFASELPESTTQKHGVTVLDTGNPRLLGFEIEGKLSKEDMDRVVEPLQHAFEGDQKIDLFVWWKSGFRFDPSIIADASVISMKLSSIGHIRRYAVVGGPHWLKNVALAMASALPVDMRAFDSDDVAEAWTWLKSANPHSE